MNDRFYRRVAVAGGAIVVVVLALGVGSIISRELEWQAKIATAIEAVEKSGHSVTRDNSGLEILIHERSSISDADLVHFRVLAQDTWMLTANGAVVDDGLLEIFENTDKIEVLKLKNTLVTGTGFKYLTGCRHLTWVSLSGCPITADGIRHVAQVKTIQTLSLANTGLPMDSIGEVGVLPNLYDLILGEYPENELRKLPDQLRKFLSIGLVRLDNVPESEHVRFQAEFPNVKWMFYEEESSETP